MEEKIKKIISEKINPVLAQHFGAAEFVEIDGKTIYIRDRKSTRLNSSH